MEELVGQQIKASSKIDALIKQLVSEVGSQNSKITGVRPPSDAHKTKGKEKIDEVGRLRGRPLYFEYFGTGAGNGVYSELEDGSVKMDLINGIGVHLFGHGHPKVIEASIRGALADVPMQSHLQVNEEYLGMIKRLTTIAGKHSKLKYAWLATCGTMANENALKLARQKNTPARMVVAMADAFAGRSTLMAEITDNKEYKVGLPDYNEVLRLPFYDNKNPRSSEDALRIFKDHVAKNEKNISAFVFEPMLGEGGYKVAPRSFFEPILAFCKEKNIAVWLDEVQTFCRTGEFFAFETLGLGEYVDLCTIAKTAQVGATLFTEHYNPKPGLIAGTFAGGTAALSAGNAILDTMANDNFLGANGRIAKVHKNFVGMLNQLNETSCKGLLRDAGGLGLMIAVTPLDGSKEKINVLIKSLFKNGILCYSCGHDPYRIRFLVPAIMSEADITAAKGILEKSILESK